MHDLTEAQIPAIQCACELVRDTRRKYFRVQCTLGCCSIRGIARSLWLTSKLHQSGFFSRPWGGGSACGKTCSRHKFLLQALSPDSGIVLCPIFVSSVLSSEGFIPPSLLWAVTLMLLVLFVTPFFPPSSKETKKPLAHSVEKIETTNTAVFYFCPAVTLQETGTQGQWVLREVVGGVQENASPWGLEKLAWLLVDDPCSYRRKRGQPVAYTHS